MRILLAGATGVIGRQAVPDVIVHMLTAIPDPIDPRYLARDMALTNRLRTEGTANLVAAAGGNARIIAHGLAYADDPAGSLVKDEGAPLWRDPPGQFGPVLAALRDMEHQVAAAGGLVLRLGHLYGPGSSYAPQGGFTRQLRAGKVPIVGDGGSMFSFHAYDAATALLAAVDHPAAGGVLPPTAPGGTVWPPSAASPRGERGGPGRPPHPRSGTSTCR